MAGDEGTRGAGDNLVKALVVKVGDVEHHAGALHLRERLDAGGGEAGMGVVPARERSLRVPAERRHEYAQALEHLDQRGVLGKERGVLDGMDAGDLAVLECGANICGTANVDHPVVIEHGLAAHVRHDLRLEARCVSGGNLVGDKRGEALRPRSLVDLCERDSAGVALDEVEILRMRLVAGEIAVGARGKAQVEIERGPADAVGGVAV